MQRTVFYLLSIFVLQKQTIAKDPRNGWKATQQEMLLDYLRTAHTDLQVLWNDDSKPTKVHLDETSE